ncbi:MAG: AzlC family ABC transporter permease [Pseudomonadota bacterium]
MDCGKKSPPASDRDRENRWTVIKDGIIVAWPICLGYAPIGLAFGVLAQKAGLSPAEIGLMSLLVFAGSAQFIAVSMISSGAAAIPIILTTFTVNLRHLLMSSSLAVHLQRLNAGWLSLYAYGVTDESFALNMTRFREQTWDWRRALVLNHTANLAWIVSTIIGGYGGQFIPAGAFGINYALPAMFICLLVLQVRGGIYVVVALIAGSLAVAFSLLFPGNAYIVTATVSAATIGVLLRKWKGRASESGGMS